MKNETGCDSPVYNIYPAPPDSKVCRSNDLQRAINEASSSHNTARRVLIHSGYYVITQPVEILSNIEIELESGVYIQSSVTDVDDWPIDEPFPVKLSLCIVSITL